MKSIRRFQTNSTRWRSTAAAAHSPLSAGASAAIPPAADDLGITDQHVTAKPYSQVPGPTPWPIIGNTWRMLPVIGM